MASNVAELATLAHGYEHVTHAALPTREKCRVGGAWRNAREAYAHAKQGSVRHDPVILMEREKPRE